MLVLASFLLSMSNYSVLTPEYLFNSYEFVVSWYYVNFSKYSKNSSLDQGKIKSYQLVSPSVP